MNPENEVERSRRRFRTPLPLAGHGVTATPTLRQSWRTTSKPLPSPWPGNRAYEIQPSFALEWADPSLGLSVKVFSESSADGDTLWAYVDSDRPAGRGYAASVVLEGDDTQPFLRLSVKLDTPFGEGSHGKVRIGTITEVQKRLQGDIRLDAFLIEPSSPNLS